MTGAELNNAFRKVLPILYYPEDKREPPQRYDYIKKIVYWWTKVRDNNNNLVDVKRVSCVLAKENRNTTIRVPIDRVRVIDVATDRTPIDFTVNEEIKKAYEEKKPVTVKVNGKINIDCGKIRELIFVLNEEKTGIIVKCVCGEGLSSVEEPIENVKVKKEKADRINYKSVVDLFNKLCTELPKVQKLTDSRKQAIKTAKESGIDFATLFLKVHKSDFLSGRSGKWKNCSFDWILKTTNRVKIMEGNFDNKAEEKAEDISASYDIDELEKIQ